jgi:hypothetical protein
MSQPDPSKKAGATFTWVLGAFAGFAVLFIAIQAISDSKQGFDPREQERRDNTAEILKAQADNIAKLGLNDPAKKKAVFEKTLAALTEKKAGVSTQVVPGSPTQLKQAAASMPPAAPAAPAAPPVPAAPTAAPAAPPAPGTVAPAPPPVPGSTPPPVPAPVPAPAPPPVPAATAPATAPAAAPAPAPAAPAPPK